MKEPTENQSSPPNKSKEPNAIAEWVINYIVATQSLR